MHGVIRRLGVILLSACLAVGSVVISPPPAAAAEAAEPAMVAQRIWAKLLTHCGETWFYSGSAFDGEGMLGGTMMAEFIEYRGVRFNLVPVRVTDADQLNGVTYRARISMIAHVYRSGSEAWSDGPDMRPRDTDEILGRAIGDANADMFGMGTSGAIALDIVKFKGRWVVARTSTTVDGMLGMGGHFIDVDKFIAARRASYSCKTGAVEQPPPTAAELAAAAEAKRQEAARMAAYNAEIEQREQVIKDGLAKWGFRGSIPEFRRALIANLERRAPEFGVDPRQYAPEIERIVQVAQTCVGITQADWDKAWHTTTDRGTQQEILHGCDGLDGGNHLIGYSVSPGGRDRAITIEPSVTAHEHIGGDFRFAPELTLNVLFDAKDGENWGDRAHAYGKYVIISAHIPFAYSNGLAGPGGALGAESQAAVDEAKFQFAGSPVEFRDALAANLVKRAAQLHFDPAAYDGDLSAINRFVASCISLTTMDWIDAESHYRADVQAPIKGRDPPVLRARRLRNCDGPDGSPSEVAVSEPSKSPGLVIEAVMSRFDPERRFYRPTHDLEIEVKLVGLPGRPTGVPVIEATLPLTERTAAR